MGSRTPLAVLALLATLGCHKATEDTCAPAQEKADVLAMTREYYLWRNELPASVDPAASATAEDLLAALTARTRAEGRDRGFSYLASRAASSRFFEEGRTLGYGFGYVTSGGTLAVAQVFPGSAADSAGFARGDELLAVAPTRAGLDDASSQAPALVAAGTFSAALQSGVEGTTRWFRLRRPATGAVLEVAATTGAYGLDPVPGGGTPTVLTANGVKVGYVQLRTFVEPAAPLLRAAAAALRQAGVTRLIVDLRYNGGGRLSVAEVLGNLLSPGHADGDVMYRLKANDGHPELGATVHFSAEAGALSLERLAFIVTGNSASASELVPNALQAWPGTQVALVGERTYGKPVGQLGYADSACDWLLELVSFQILNARGTGSYFQGLPDADWTGVTVAAADDLAHAPGDPAEACTAAALAWAAGGTGGAPIPAAAARRAGSLSLHPRPTEAQRALPGVF